MPGGHRSFSWTYLSTTVCCYYSLSPVYSLECECRNCACRRLFLFSASCSITPYISRHQCGQTSCPVVRAEIQIHCNIKASWGSNSLFLGDKCPSRCSLNIQNQLKIAFCLFCALLTLSLLVSVFSYAKIFKTLRYRQVQVHRNTQQGQRPNGGGNQLNIARYKRTVYSIAWVQLALLICYIPYILLGFLRLFRKLPFSTKLYITTESFVTLVYLNSSLNPALYCWRIRDVKQEVKNMICKIFCCF